MLPEPQTCKDKRFDISFEKGRRGEEWVTALGTNHCQEIKTDFLWYKTGNLFFEYSSRGLLSGLATTKALYWTVVLDREGQRMGMVTFYIPDLKKNLRYLLAIKAARKAKGGDDDTSEGILVPMELIPTLWNHEHEHATQVQLP